MSTSRLPHPLIPAFLVAAFASACAPPPAAPPPPLAPRASLRAPASAPAPAPSPPAPPPALADLAPRLAPALAVEAPAAAKSAPDPADAPSPPALLKDLAPRLPNGLFNPMPGGILAGYRADTGLDIAGFRRPVHALASGTLDYSEAGHTLWTSKSDSPYCVRLALDAPIPWKGRRITHVYYAHLHAIEHHQPEGAPRTRVQGGERLGVSGIANGSPHLHLGLLLDGRVDQSWGTFLLEDEVREVLGGYRKGFTLR